MDVHPSRKSDVIEERGVGGAPTGMRFLTEFGRKLAGMKKSYSVGAPPPLALRRGVVRAYTQGAPLGVDPDPATVGRADCDCPVFDVDQSANVPLQLFFDPMW
jgi:hypothetical protein